MEYSSKGAAMTTSGRDTVNDRPAYVIDIRMPSGGLHRVWVDTETYLELRFDREIRDASGRTAVATVFYRDYRPFEGLQIPVTIETGGASGQAQQKLVIERVALNPPLDDHAFAKPEVPVARHARGAVVDTRSAAAAMVPVPAGAQ